MNTESIFVTEVEAARILGLSVWTLRRSRSDLRNGPSFYRIGGRVVYKRAEIITWVESHRVEIPMRRQKVLRMLA